MLSRRRVLALLASAVVFPVASSARATTARAVRVADLARASELVSLVTQLDRECRWETLGKRKRIVTYSRVRVDAPIAGASEAGDELVVRTLGGRVGDVGQIVPGEAVLVARMQQMLFLGTGQDGALAVTGMAQGHYLVRTAAKGPALLEPSPRLASLAGRDRDSAVVRLSGVTLDEAKRIVGEAWAKK